MWDDDKNRNKKGPDNQSPLQKHWKWAVGGLAALGLLYFMAGSGTPNPEGGAQPSEMGYSEFKRQLDNGHVTSVTIQKVGENTIIQSHMDNGDTVYTYAVNDPHLVEELDQKNVPYTQAPAAQPNGGLFGMLMSFAPMLLLVGVWIFMMRRMQGGGAGGAMGFGKSKAKLLTQASGRVTFDDVAGIDEAKADLQETVDFLKDPYKFQRLGAKIPRGLLLVGPPGTGKTLVARAVAGEANVPFFSISGSDFVEMFVGVGASRVRDMFDQAKKNSPCIIFIDEIDAVGRHRGAGMGGGNDEREQTLNQLLVEMDGFEANEGVILIAATNRPDVLDPALLRPGRFDRQVVVPNPDLIGRERILKVHVRNKPLGPDVDLKVVARGTPGFSGADLMNLCNEAALLAARRGLKTIGRKEFDDSRDKILLGAERRTMAVTEQEKKLTAYHEAGHAVLALKMAGNTDPIHKATIIPRGRALGMVMQLPERDQVSMNLAQMRARLVILFGGRIAEELIFGKDKVTSGAMSDIQQATKLARAMVTQWGFSDKLGRVQYEGNEQEVFLGHSVTQKKNVSEMTAQIIDEEVRRLIDEAETEARKLLREDNQLELVTKALLDYETLTGEEVALAAQGKDIARKPDEPIPAGLAPAANDLLPPPDAAKMMMPR